MVKNKFYLGEAINYLIILIILTIIFLFKETLFQGISLIFILLGGLGEYIFKNKFYSKETNKISFKDNLKTKIKNGFLWVHANIFYIKKYGTKIYNYEKVGILVSSTAYVIMLIYILAALALYNQFSEYGLLIYLIPIISNLYFFIKNKYILLDLKK